MERVALGNCLVASAGDPSVRPPDQPVLGVLLDEREQTGVLTLAQTLATATDGSLRLIRPVVYPPQTPPGLARDDAVADKRLLTDALSSVRRWDPELDSQGDVVLGRDTISTVLHAVDRWQPRAIVFDVTPDATIRSVLRGPIAERVATKTDCPVVAVNKFTPVQTVSSILVPVANGPHSLDAVRTATSLASEAGAYVDLLHVENEDAETEPPFERAIEAASGFPRLDTYVVEGSDIVETIVEQTDYYDLTVIGGPESSRLRRFVFGSDTTEIGRNADSSVITVWSGRGD